MGDRLICKNCKNSFKGNYCNVCGEKIVQSKDFTLKHFLFQAFGAITNFDSKWLQSMKLLLFFPGKLSSKYVEGIRVPYMKPFQIFLVANLVFFIFLSDTDLFRTPSQWFFQANFDGIKVLQKVEHIAKEQQLTISEVAMGYDNKSSNLAKGLIILLIPFFALIGKIFHPKKTVEFGKHLLYAAHFFSFFLLLCVLIAGLLKIIPLEANRWYFIVPLVTILLIYQIVGYRNFYKDPWLAAIMKGFIALLLTFVILRYYAFFINIISLNSL